MDGIRLLCRAHNQYEAERPYGAEFMRQKRTAAAEARAEAKRQAQAAREQATAAEDAHVLEVVPWLRALGFKSQESREAAELCREMRGASLEERVRVALSCLQPRGTRKVRPWTGAGPAAPIAVGGAVGTGP